MMRLRVVALGFLLGATTLAGQPRMAAARTPQEEPAGPAPVQPDWGTAGTGGVIYNPNPSGTLAGKDGSAAKVIDVNIQDCNNATGHWYAGGDTVAKVTCNLENLAQFTRGFVQFLGNPVGAAVQFLSNQLLGDPSCRHHCPSDDAHPAGRIAQILLGTPAFFNHDAGEWGTDNIFSRLWSVSLSIAVILVALAAGLRLMRMVLDHQALSFVAPQMTTRVVVGLAAAGLSYKVLGWLAVTSADIGVKMFLAFAQVGAAPGDGTLTAALLTLQGTSGAAAILVLLPVLAALLVMLYVVALMIARWVILVFAVALAPVAIAVGVYDTRNEFFGWWARMLSGALVAPIITGVVLGITFGVAADFAHSMPFLGPAASGVLLLGGFIVLGKALSHLTMGALHSGAGAGGLVAAAAGAIGERGLETAGVLPMVRRGAGGAGAAPATSPSITTGVAAAGAALISAQPASAAERFANDPQTRAVLFDMARRGYRQEQWADPSAGTDETAVEAQFGAWIAHPANQQTAYQDLAWRYSMASMDAVDPRGFGPGAHPQMPLPEAPEGPDAAREPIQSEIKVFEDRLAAVNAAVAAASRGFEA
ncbi:MAG: hypothetical protein ACYDGR_03235 [Candidatus Dormibacteria bacterium]